MADGTPTENDGLCGISIPVIRRFPEHHPILISSTALDIGWLCDADDNGKLDQGIRRIRLAPKTFSG
jgi:hypothetical protein